MASHRVRTHRLPGLLAILIATAIAGCAHTREFIYPPREAAAPALQLRTGTPSAPAAAAARSSRAIKRRGPAVDVVRP